MTPPARDRPTRGAPAEAARSDASAPPRPHGSGSTSAPAAPRPSAPPTPSGDPHADSVGRHTGLSAGRPAAAAHAASTTRTASAPAAPAAARSSSLRADHRDARTTDGSPAGHP